MGRFILCGKEAQNPFEIEELDLRIYTIEELCYYIYHNLSLLDDSFIDNRLLEFIGGELEMKDLQEKIIKFYTSAADLDTTLQMILRDVGYYSDLELQEFQKALVSRKRQNSSERTFSRAECLMEKGCYHEAARCYQSLLRVDRSSRVETMFYLRVMEREADCYGFLGQYERAFRILRQIYKETREERLLKKMYCICIFASIPLPDDLFGSIGDVTLANWQKEYWSQESILEHSMEQSPEMDIFLQDSVRVKEYMEEYIAQKKKEYRAMLS